MFVGSGCARHACGLFLSFGLLAVTGCSAPQGADPDGPPDVVLITLDTTRADHCSFLGYERETTPRIGALARRGATFTAAYTPTPTTGAAHATLLTGLHPRTHGVVRNAWALAPERETLAEVLAAAGYATGAVVSAFPLARRFGFGQGFDHYDDEFLPEEASLRPQVWDGIPLEQGYDRRARATTDRALRWFESVPRRRPLFLWVHYYDPHAPYDPPPRYAGLFRPDGGRALLQEVARYDAEIRFADDQVGRLLDEVGRRRSLEQALVVIATDHGEGLMQHGWMEHGVNLYEELVRVALVVRWPPRVVPGPQSAPVMLTDVMPTMLTLLRLPVPPGTEGQDLSPLLLHGVPPPERRLYFQRRFYTTADRDEWPARGGMTAVREGRWKYVDAPDEGTHALFDLASDPDETQNVLAAQPAVGEALGAAVRAWRDHPGGRAIPAQPISDDDRERLRALGYLD